MQTEYQNNPRIYCYYQLFYNAVKNYNIFKALKNGIYEGYCNAYQSGYNGGVSISEFDIDVLLLREYYLWLFHNDISELSTLFATRGKMLAEIYVRSGFDLFKSGDKEYGFLPERIKKETREFVTNTFMPLVEVARRNHISSNNVGRNHGIYNLFTGDIIRSNDGTYYVDDFRPD